MNNEHKHNLWIMLNTCVLNISNQKPNIWNFRFFETKTG